MTKTQIQDTIGAFIEREKKIPTGKDITSIDGVDITARQAQAAILQYKRENVNTLNIIRGRVYDSDGVIVWHKNSAGSMMPASFYPDLGIGQYISH